jgi:hypothetical protein
MFKITLFYPKINKQFKLHLNIMFYILYCVVHDAYALSANIN